MKSARLALFAALASAAFTLTSAAFAAVPDGILHIESGPCGAAPVLSGSAVVIESAGKFYALTSESLALKGAAYCHVFHNAAGAAIDGKLIAADWDHGLALFEVASGPALTKLDEPSEEISRGVPLRIAGWSAASKAFDEMPSSLLLLKSRRHSFISFDYLAEVDAPKLDAGFSGGALLGAESRWLGLVSSEYIKMTPGQASFAAEWAYTQTGVKKDGLIVSAGEARNWMHTVFAGKVRPTFEFDPKARLEGRRQMGANGLQFAMDCPPESAEPGSDPNYPIGGTDAIGIGGDSAANKACRLTVTRVGSVSPGGNFGGLFTHMDGLFSQGAEHLSSIFLTNESPIDHSAELQTFSSLGRVFQFLSHDVDLVLLAWRPGATVPGINDKAKELATIAADLKIEAQKVFRSPSHIEKSLQLLRRIYFISEYVSSQIAHWLRKDEIPALLDRSGDRDLTWRYVDWNFGFGSHVYEKLQALQAEYLRVYGAL